MHLKKSKQLFKFEFEPTLQEYPEGFRHFYKDVSKFANDVAIHDLTGNLPEILQWINRLPVKFRYDCDELIAIILHDEEFKVLDVFKLD